MKLLDGKKIKLEMLNKLKEELENLDRKLGLTVIQVGDDEASKIYVKQKAKMADFLGYSFNHIKLSVDVSQDYILSLIDELNNDDLVDGILVQMPLPKGFDAKLIQNRILPSKDVDGLTEINSGKLAHGVECLIPCTPLGILDILTYYEIPVASKNIVVVGRSDLVGKPVASLMLNNNATVTICHSKTNNLADFTKNADILIVAVGKKGLITGEMVKDNSVIIDVGMNRVNGKLYGDVDFDSVKEKVSFITPVPGGVGQMTVAELGRNVHNAYMLRRKNL